MSNDTGTAIESTIGASGCDYTKIQDWFDAAPSNLTTHLTTGRIWRGLCKNEKHTAVNGSGTVLNASGKTADGTRYFELTTDTGCSFRDQSGVRSTRLAYVDSANAGARLETDADGATTIVNTIPYFRVSNLMIASVYQAAPSGRAITSEVHDTQVDNCILQARNTVSVVSLYGSGCVMRNCLVVAMRSSASYIIQMASGPELYNCTFAVPSDYTAASYGIDSQYYTATIKNCAFFGVTAVYNGTQPSFTTCKTDVGGDPMGAGSTVAYSTSSGAYFENITSSTYDYRIKSGSALADAGTTDSTNGAYDISKLARPSGSGYDVGCWEYSSGAAAAPSGRNLLLKVG